jgi:hypothetical protein
MSPLRARDINSNININSDNGGNGHYVQNQNQSKVGNVGQNVDQNQSKVGNVGNRNIPVGMGTDDLTLDDIVAYAEQESSLVHEQEHDRSLGISQSLSRSRSNLSNLDEGEDGFVLRGDGYNNDININSSMDYDGVGDIGEREGEGEGDGDVSDFWNVSANSISLRRGIHGEGDCVDGDGDGDSSVASMASIASFDSTGNDIFGDRVGDR